MCVRIKLHGRDGSTRQAPTMCCCQLGCWQMLRQVLLGTRDLESCGNHGWDEASQSPSLCSCGPAPPGQLRGHAGSLREQKLRVGRREAPSEGCSARAHIHQALLLQATGLG